MTTTDTRLLPPPPPRLLHKACLFLDLDGTLIEIASRPDGVVVNDGLIAMLARLQRRLDGRLVVVSGRSAEQVRSLLRLSDLAVAGSHGAELIVSGGTQRKPAAAAPAEHVAEELRRWAARYPGVLIEHKPFGLAIHYRLAPEAAPACEDMARRLAAAEGYQLQPGKQVIELKFHNLTKGDAVRACMALAPMRDGRPLFIGDDLTDEAGFEAVAELGGAGILVGPPRPTHARFSLDDVAAALRWLEHAAGALP